MTLPFFFFLFAKVVSVCVPRKRFLGNCCNHRQTWHDDCLRQRTDKQLNNTIMYHVLIILTLNFIQDRIDLNHETNKCLIISETIQAMPIIFAVKIVRQKVYRNYDHCQSDDLDLQGHKCVSGLTTF